MFVTIATVCIILVFINLSWRYLIKNFSHIPEIKYGIPFIGHVFRFPSDTKDLIKFTEHNFKETKSKTYITWLPFFKNFVLTMDTEIFKHVLKSNVHIEKGEDYNLLNDWLGTGLLISSGEKWKKRRRLLTPAFHFNILSKHSDLLSKHAQYLILYLRHQHSQKNVVEISSVVKHFALDSLSETAMGIHCNTLGLKPSDSIEAQYINSVDIVTRLAARRFTEPWNRNPFIYKLFDAGRKYFHNVAIAKGFVKSVIEERIECLKDVKDIQSPIFLDLLIAAHKRNEIDVEGIIEEVNTFMFEGYDTVSSAISWTIYMLGRHSHVQEKLFNEMAQVSFEKFDFQQIDQLKYLECVIKETLRMHPSVPKIIRHFKNDVILGNNFKLPAETNLVLHIYFMHRDESIWKNALTFLPERFLEEEILSKRGAFVFTPFSAGPRNCIGQRYAMMELKIVLFHLIRSFHFESIHEESELDMHNDIVHSAANGIWVRYQPR